MLVKGRPFHACTTASRRLHRAETVDLENSVPQSSSVIWAILRVGDPLDDHLYECQHQACSLL